MVGFLELQQNQPMNTILKKKAIFKVLKTTKEQQQQKSDNS